MSDLEESADAAPGIIVIMIDGLGRERLTRALKSRHMPFTRRLLRKRGYALVPTRAGVPATTPAVQAELMYGVRGVIPGFRWYEKATGRMRVMKNFEDIGSVRARLPEEQGLFRGGAVYTAFFSGGAGRAYFVPGQSNPGAFAGPVKPRQVPLFMLKHFLPIARILGLSFYELWLELLDYLDALVRRRPRRGEGLFPLERVISNAVLREVSTIGLLQEIRRNTPAIFANFVGFDVMGHHRGPRSLSASMALTAIDRKIRRVWRAAERSARRGGRRYELYLLSDHGQTPAVPFERRAGRSLREAILEQEFSARVQTLGQAEYRDTVHSAAVLGRLRQIQRLLPWPLRPLAAFAARRIEARLEVAGQTAMATGAAELLVLPTGGLAHIYFLDCPGRLDLAEIEERHPGLLRHLTSLAGVRAVVGRSGSQTIVRGRDGELAVGSEVRLTGSDPLAGVGPTEEIARELAALSAQAQCGDLVVLAGKIGRRRLVRRGVIYANFLEELGAHGGAEPPEQDTFLICPQERAGLFPEGCRAAEVYKGLLQVRGLPQAGN
jgi:Type I phosphodiesterase / nucleotide pyrophosphatase